MKTVVVYESIYGNTRAIAHAIADGLVAEAVPVHLVTDELTNGAALVVGGPTHVHGLATARSRQMAVEAAEEDGERNLEPGATAQAGLRTWLRDLPDVDGIPTAAFDTRVDKSSWLTGVASRGIAKRLARRGYEVLCTESFLVEDSEGPLKDGELDRARAWGEQLARSLELGARQAAR